MARCEYSCAYLLPIAHTRLGVHRAPGIPHALCFQGGDLLQTSDASRREIADVCRQYTTRHRPRRRAIQYSEASAIDPRSRGVLDTPHARGMTIRCKATKRCPSCVLGLKHHAKQSILARKER